MRTRWVLSKETYIRPMVWVTSSVTARAGLGTCVSIVSLTLLSLSQIDWFCLPKLGVVEGKVI